MTVPTETIEISYPGLGNETRTEFPYAFPVLDEDHLVVKVIDLSTSPNTEMRLTKNTHYEVHGTGNTGGGHVRLIDLTAITGNTRLTSQFNLLIQRKVPVLQEMDLQNQGGFIAENHERKFDYLTMIDQQLQAELDRCVKTTEPYGQTADRLLPSVAAVVAGMYSDIIDIDSDYTVAQTNNGNLLRVDTSGGDVTITLPDTDDLGADMRFSAIKWTDDDNAVIIRSQPTESINNSPHIRIDKEYYSSIVVSDSASDMWVALSSDTPPMKDIILDTFTADSDDQASYTLSYAPGNKNNTRLFINGEYVKKDDYSVPGTTLTLNATLAATIEEDDEVEVFYNRPLALGVPALDSVTADHLQADSVTLAKMAHETSRANHLIYYDSAGVPSTLDSVTADHLQADSVTLAKMAHETSRANHLIYYDSAGVPSSIALSSVGSGWQTMRTIICRNLANEIFDLGSTYNTFMVQIDGVTSPTAKEMMFYSGTNSAFSSNYEVKDVNNRVQTHPIQGPPWTYFPLSTPTRKVWGSIYIYDRRFFIVSTTFVSSDQVQSYWRTGRTTQSGAVTRIKLKFKGSPKMRAGKITLCGLKEVSS